MRFQKPCFPRSNVAMATNVLPGEKRRFGASGRWRGRNPLGKKADVAIATKILPGKKAKFCKSIKNLSSHFRNIYYQILGHFRERKTGENTERPLRSKEHKVWRDSQDHWGIMACFHSISSFLLVRLPCQWVARLFLLGLNLINSTSMYSLWLWCCLI